MLEREAAALRESALQKAEAQRWKIETESLTLAVKQAKRAGIKTAVITGLVCIASGIVAGLAINN
jgi:hypothetical protein